MNSITRTKNTSSPAAQVQGNLTLSSEHESGFTLIETVIAMVIILIAVLGVLVTMSYAIKYNGGNNGRTQSLAVLQEEIERLRSAKFTPGQTDTALLSGTVIQTVESNNLFFSVTTVVDDDPNTPDVQSDLTSSLKEIRVTAILANPSPGWETAVPATAVLRRVRSN